MTETPDPSVRALIAQLEAENKRLQKLLLDAACRAIDQGDVRRQRLEAAEQDLVNAREWTGQLNAVIQRYESQLADLEAEMRRFAERHPPHSDITRQALAWADTIRNVSRVDDSQYAAPLATASKNEVIR